MVCEAQCGRNIVNHAFVLSCVQLFVMPCTGAHQASLSMEFLRQGYWSRFPFSSPRGSSWSRDRILISCVSPALQVDSLSTEPWRKPTMLRSKSIAACFLGCEKRETSGGTRDWITPQLHNKAPWEGFFFFKELKVINWSIREKHGFFHSLSLHLGDFFPLVKKYILKLN